MKLTKAQAWALKVLSDGRPYRPAALGQEMMERPGVVRHGGNQNSRQGLGRIGGTMSARLVKMGLAREERFRWDGRLWSNGIRISASGLSALAEQEKAG